jgi:hypothetical protein
MLLLLLRPYSDQIRSDQMGIARTHAASGSDTSRTAAEQYGRIDREGQPRHVDVSPPYIHNHAGGGGGARVITLQINKD